MLNAGDATPEAGGSGGSRTEIRGPGGSWWSWALLQGFLGLRFSFEFQWLLSEGWGKQGLTVARAKFLALHKHSWPGNLGTLSQLKVLLAAALFPKLGVQGTVGDKTGLLE